ncbi:MAG: efflux RND transporter periplasmic adaptor subunit [Endomicrobiales bacterium]|nr:efflux RND transporter periplasmic adaptor subunit [Endomicrobiales bacterium]
MKKFLNFLKEKIWPKLYSLAVKIIPKTKKRKIIFFSSIAFVLILGIAVKSIFFKKKGEVAEESKLFQVRVKPAKKENFTETYSVMGTIKGAIENELRFEIDGILSMYNFSEGDYVEKGQVICALDPRDAMTKVDYARSRYQSEKSIYFSASQRLKVYEELFAMKALSESKIQEARYETMSAKAKMQATLSELELAQLNLTKTNLIAPENGLLAQILIKPGEYITPQDVVAKFISGSDTNFEVDVPEKDMNKIKINQKVKINCDAFPDREFLGKLIEIAPTVKERTRTTTVKIGIPNPDGELRSGMFGRGTIYIFEVDNVIGVPHDSVIALGDSTFLVPILKPDDFTKDEGIVELRHVTLGEKLEKLTIIEDGILPDELIVAETQGQLSDGVRVKYAVIEEEKEEQKEQPQGF